MPRPVALEAHDLQVGFGPKVALASLNLTAREGEVTALLGPNGAGKTTFIRVCTGLISPQKGDVKIFGESPATPNNLARIGVMPQQTGAWAQINARSLLQYLGALYANPLPATELMELLDITPYANTPYRRLSGGQQQAVNLAGALIGRPSLLFLDEPTAGADVRAKRQVWALLDQVRSAGVSLLLTTHDMREAEELSDLVYIIDHGKIAVSGALSELTATDSLEEVFLTYTEAGVADA